MSVQYPEFLRNQTIVFNFSIKYHVINRVKAITHFQANRWFTLCKLSTRVEKHSDTLKKLVKSSASINHHVTGSFHHFPILFWCISELRGIPGKANQRGHWGLKTLLSVDTDKQELQSLRTGQLVPRFSLGGKDGASQYHIQQLLFWNWPSKTRGIKYLLLQGCKEKIIWIRIRSVSTFQKGSYFKKKWGEKKAMWKSVTLLKSFFGAMQLC